MYKIVNKEELINYSIQDLKAIVRPGTVVIYSTKREPIVLSGNEKIVSALGGELLKDKTGHFYLGGEKEPSGILLANGKQLHIGSIEEVMVND